MKNYNKVSINNEPRTELHDVLELTGAEISVNALPAGASVPFVHAHKQNEEIYAVIEGNGHVVIDCEKVELSAGDWLRIAPAAKRQFFASDNNGIKYICIQVKANSLEGYTMTDAVLVDRSHEIPSDEYSQKRLLRALFNMRMPASIGTEFLRIQDEYLQEEIRTKGITDVAALTPCYDDIYLWRGDITTLKCDGIVNAANSQMLGCFCPNHACIDNAIHTYAGVQLRQECAEIMQAQGREEQTGQAKITKAYNLPCQYVLHTVGPIVYGKLTERHEKELANCYRSCLELADKNGLQSIAFCCISTGEFRFPNERAAEIAIKTVTEYKQVTQSKIKIIFNVFKEVDHDIYARLLGANC